jgi:hypothetical protein
MVLFDNLREWYYTVSGVGHRFKCIALVVAAAILLPFAVAERGFGQELEAKGIEFNAKMPEEVKREKKKVEYMGAEAEVIVWTGKKKGCCEVRAFVGGLEGIPGIKEVSGLMPKPLVEKAADVVKTQRAKQVDGKVKGTDRFTLQGYPARDIALSANGGEWAIITRVVVVDYRVAGVEIGMPRKEVTSKYVEEVFSSFRLVRLKNRGGRREWPDTEDILQEGPQLFWGEEYW